MSNKIVPMIYRAIIDDVIANIKSEFDDYGVGEDVLGELQSRWENKVIASHVAEFEPLAPASQVAPQHHYPPHVSHPSLSQMHATYPQYISSSQPQVKSEPVENRFPLPSNMPTYIPTLPGPTLPGPPRLPSMQTQTQQHYVAAPSNGAGRPLYPQAPVPADSTQAQPQPRMPQVDGPSSSTSESPSPPPSQSYAPRSSHPSLPQPPQGAKPVADSEEINSDLDDSDTDGEEDDQEGTLGETDIVFCTYDKVARVKNKWKCVLKDGMIHVNGKDYLFAKCTCEFEW